MKMGLVETSKQNLIKFVLLAVLLKDISGNEGLKPIAPVRKVGEDLEFHCESPANFSDPNILFRLEHDGKNVVDNAGPSSMRPDNDAYIYKYTYTLSSVDYKHAGEWECSIIGQSINYTQQLIVIQGNSNATILEDGVGGMLDCLADADKVYQNKIMVDWQVAGKKIENSDKRFIKRRDSQLEVKEISLADVNMEFDCIVTAKGSNAGLDSSRMIMLPFSVVKTECSRYGSNFTAKAQLCGVKPHLTIEWFMKEEKLNSTNRADIKDNSSCITSWVNSTSCNMDIHISQGDTVVWTKNISEETPPEATQPKTVNVPTVVGLVAVVLVVGGIVGIVLYKCWKRNRESTKNSQPDGQADLSTRGMLNSQPTSNNEDDDGANGDH